MFHHLVCKNSQKTWQMHFMAVRKSRKRVIYWDVEDSAFTAAERDAKF